MKLFSKYIVNLMGDLGGISKERTDGTEAPASQSNALNVQRTLPIVDQYYAVTIKCNLKDRIYNDLDIKSIIGSRFKKFNFIESCYELDSNGKLHLHALAEANSKIFYKGIRQYGWNIHVEPLRTSSDKERWVKYIRKDQHKNSLMEFYSANYNLFDLCPDLFD